MPATLEQLEPSSNGAGKIGTSSARWGEGHFVALYLNGGAVAPVASPTFTGTPAAPTASPGTNTTQIATTAFVTAADVVAKARANHTGTQLASTISDFDAAVAATTSGAASHAQNSDTKLANGTGNEVTAADLRTHLDDATKHRQINDSATTTTNLWSASKINTMVAGATASGDLAALDTVGTSQIDDGAVTAAKLASDAVTTAKIDDEAVTGAKVEGGTAAPGNSKYWGTSSLGVFGFHSMPTGVPTGALADLDTVGAAQIDAGAVIEAKIGTGAVTAGKLASDAVTTAKILDANITAAKLATSAVTTAKINDAAVTGAKVEGGTAAPGNSKYWGTSSGGTFGFHTLPTGSGINNVVEDTTPQLGGPLDCNAFAIREAVGAAVGSATALNLGSDGNYFSVTGTTTITSIATEGVGTRVTLRFVGILTLTHHATDLILPTAANITTAAGDVAVFREYATGDWVCESYQRASGYALAGGTFNPATPGPIGGTTAGSGTFTEFVATTSAFLPNGSVGAMPAPGSYTGGACVVTNAGSDGQWDYCLAISDGSVWKYCSDGATVS